MYSFIRTDTRQSHPDYQVSILILITCPMVQNMMKIGTYLWTCMVIDGATSIWKPYAVPASVMKLLLSPDKQSFFVLSCLYWHQSLSVSIPFLSPNACDWSIRQIHDHDWLRVMAEIQNVPKQSFQDSNAKKIFGSRIKKDCRQ